MRASSFWSMFTKKDSHSLQLGACLSAARKVAGLMVLHKNGRSGAHSEAGWLQHCVLTPQQEWEYPSEIKHRSPVVPNVSLSDDSAVPDQHYSTRNLHFPPQREQ